MTKNTEEKNFIRRGKEMKYYVPEINELRLRKTTDVTRRE